ncbi:hypothetical protein [Aeromonas jandaei]|uniref:hypothetical protein n=2 Tax=Aeromonas TaxID=642 RepID=UPI0012EC954C|nr:hypothetical protein [Aeromonas jandaei]MVG14115.1 hypothetical protein [Aeromonas jandaei]
MVRYTGPPADRQRGGQPPQSIYQTKKGQGCDKNSQPSENKGVISKNSVLFTATDEGDDGVGSVIDTTKVTSSTPADQPLPQPHKEQFEGVCSQDRPPQTGQAEERHPGRKAIARAKNGLCSTPKPLGAMASCLVLLSNWQVIIK